MKTITTTTYTIAIPSDVINARFNKINDDSDLMKSLSSNKYNLTDDFFCITDFSKLTNRELVHIIYNIRDLLGQENLETYYLMGNDGEMNFTIIDKTDASKKDTVIIRDLALLSFIESTFQISFSYKPQKIDRVNTQILSQQIAKLLITNTPHHTHVTVNQDNQTLSLRTSELDAILKGVAHIAYVLEAFSEYKWIKSGKTPLAGKSYKSLFITPLKEIVLLIYSIEGQCIIEEYNFYLNIDGYHNSRLSSILSKHYGLENEQLMEALIKLDRKYQLTSLLKDL